MNMLLLHIRDVQFSKVFHYANYTFMHALISVSVETTVGRIIPILDYAFHLGDIYL